MHVQFRPTFDAVRFDQSNDTHLVLSLKAPKKDWEKQRPPICIFPVIDVSGSMSGAKLDYAKKSAIKIVEHLQPGDFCGLATFSTNVRLVLPPQEMTQVAKNGLIAAIGELCIEGNTNFSGGMLLGLEQLNKADLPDNLIRRVVMLTDGCANCGAAVQPEQILDLCKQQLGSATLSAFGYGADCNQQLLSDLAQLAKGNYAFIENPDKALNAFAKELGGLLSTYAQDVEVTLESSNGHTITQVVSDVDVSGDEKKVTIKVPDLLSEEERHLVVAFKLSEQSKALPRPLNVAEVTVSYATLDAKGKKTSHSETLKAKVNFTKHGEEQVKPHPELEKIVDLAVFVQKQLEAEKLANQGQYDQARGVLDFMAKEVKSKGNVALGNHYENLGQRMGSSALYVANAGYILSNRAVMRGYGASGGSSLAMADAAAIGAACFNSEAQQVMTNNFVGDASAAPAAVGGTVVGAVNINIGVPGTTGTASALIVPPQAPKKTSKPKSGVTKDRSKRW